MNNYLMRFKNAHKLSVSAGLVAVCIVTFVAWFYHKKDTHPIKTEHITKHSSQTETLISQAKPTLLASDSKQSTGLTQPAHTMPNNQSQQPSPSTSLHLDFPPQYVPPIGKKIEREESYQGDLTDLAAYQVYEHNQQKRLKLAYIQASKAKISELTHWLNRGQAAQLSTEQLNEAKEKISALQNQTDQLTQQLNQ